MHHDGDDGGGDFYGACVIGDCDYYIKNICILTCLTIYYLVMMTMVQIVETICWFMRWMEWDEVEIMAYFFGQSPLTHTIHS